MKLSSLLAQRRALQQQAHLANLGFAYQRLAVLAARIARARLRGGIRLQQAAPATGRYWASLTALEGRQSVIEEYFADEDLMDFADAIAYATGESEIDLVFRLEELPERFLAPLRARLEQAGVAVEAAESPLEESSSEGSTGCSQVDEGG